MSDPLNSIAKFNKDATTLMHCTKCGWTGEMRGCHVTRIDGDPMLTCYYCDSGPSTLIEAE